MSRSSSSSCSWRYMVTGTLLGALAFTTYQLARGKKQSSGCSPKKQSSSSCTILSCSQRQKWEGRSILSVEQFTREDLDELFQVADYMETQVESKGVLNICSDSLLTLLFYEPSTRTRCSFESAMLRLGGKTVVIADAKSQSSVKKGETVEDTIRCLQSYSNVIAMRHPEMGSAKRAASVASVPILNGGDGPGEHPTQALLDSYTIYKHCGQIDGLTISLLGDLKYGRTTHSLAKLLTCFTNVTINYVAPPALQMPEEFMTYVEEKSLAHDLNITQNVYDSLEDVLGTTDVLYVTRIQKERFQNVEEYEKVKDTFILDMGYVSTAKPGMKIMHPLPRVNEISVEVDDYQGAIYFDQMRCGMLLRMALIASVLGKI